MNKLVWTLKQLHTKDRSGGEQTRANRWTMLKQMAATLEAEGFRKLQAQGLKPKHVDCLIKRWQTEISPRTGRALSPATIKNRVAVIRWWAQAVGKSNILPASNDDLGIERRAYATNENKAQMLTEAQLASIHCPHVRASLQLQHAFGLRREEALKFNPSLANKGDHIHLLGSWCKGGRPRSVPILSPAQRQALNNALQIAPTGSLIPRNASYKQHLQTWKRETERIGLPRTHGLRHAYAQARYRELTDREPPNRGGCSRKKLTGDQAKVLDRHARLQIAEELGHSRIEITNTYLGR